MTDIKKLNPHALQRPVKIQFVKEVGFLHHHFRHLSHQMVFITGG